MWTKLSSLYDAIRGSLWFVPSLMAGTAVLLAFVSLWIDHELIGGDSAGKVSWLYGGGADGAREVLSTVASSMITVAGVIFSITVVALTLASQQFGPRLLRNFMRDLGNQVVLGTFISIYLYCLVILRAVRTEEAGGFIPQLSVSITLLLALVGAGVLIYFFHHATSSIRASSVIAAVARDLDGAIDRLFPDRVEQPGPSPASPETPFSLRDFDRGSRPIRALASGYVEAVDTGCLIALARKDDLVIRLDFQPGDFLMRDTTIARAFPGERTPDELQEHVNEAVMLGEERTVVQDVMFPAHQLAEMAVRALSPGTNDPSTALACIDRLGEAFIHLAIRQPPSPYRYDDTGRLRLIVYPVRLSDMVEETFGQIRQYGRTSTAVTLRLLETIAKVGPHVTSEEAREALERQAAMIQRGSADGLPEEGDRHSVQERYHAVVDALRPRKAA